MTSVVGLRFSTCGDKTFSRSQFSGMDLTSWHFTLSTMAVWAHELPCTSSHTVSAMNSLMLNQRLAKSWFQLCTTTHSRCRPRPWGSNFPTRLLEIDASEKHTSVRIMMADKNSRAGECMTLSHCWGTAQFITPRSGNIEELKEGIKLERLPGTFQEAMAVARWLKIKYLWIDSLCILQDSKEDWVKESATMRSVYSHSIMNISATGAADSNRLFSGSECRQSTLFQCPSV